MHASIDKCLKNLGTDYVDVYMIHWPDPATPFEETMSALDDIVRDGKVRFVGVSNFRREQIEILTNGMDIESPKSVPSQRTQRPVTAFFRENSLYLPSLPDAPV